MSAPTAMDAALNLQPNHTGIARDAPGVCLRLDLDLGHADVAQRCFRGAMVTPAELEHAIEVVEDSILRAGPLPGAGQGLQTDGPPPGVWLRAHWPVPVGGERRIGVEAVEDLFQDLASSVLGHPQRARGLADDPVSVAVLVLLRELMHHGPYTHWTLRG